MGWYYDNFSRRKDQIADLVKGSETVYEDGNTVSRTTVAHCYRGNPFSGVLWSVQSVAVTTPAGEVVRNERWIQCDKLEYSKGYGWGYKPMDESMGPYYFSCPLGYLNMAPPSNEKWRESVRAYHAKRKRGTGPVAAFASIPCPA